MLFVATEAGTVYALRPRDGSVVWRHSFSPVDTGGCGSWGITSTGAVDFARGLLYVANADGYVHALSLSSGEEASGWPVQVITRTTTEYVWGALRIVAGRLVVPVASYCDEPDAAGVPAEGRLVAIALDDPTATPLAFDPAPGFGNLAGVWGWGGVSVSPDRSLIYTGVGNSAPEPDEVLGYGESLVALTPDLGRVAAWSRPFVPSGPVDTDLGAAPVIFEPRGCPTLAALNSKSGSLYLWRLSQLAGGPIQSVPLSDGIHAFVGEPSWSPRTQTLYDAGATFLRGGVRLGSGIMALHVGFGCRLEPTWSAVLGDGSQPPPLVAGDVVFGAGGSSGGYEAHAAKNGVLLWRFATPGARTWAPLIAASGAAYAADTSGAVYAFQPKPAARRSR
jgi:outer membrane protein assembly factor BamB